MSNDQPLYGVDNSETVHDTIMDAIDGLDETQFPARVTVFRRMKPNPKRLATHVLECALEYLDEDLSDPDGDAATKTPEMHELAQRFADELCKIYVPWGCEPTGKSFWVNIKGEVVE